MLTVVFKKAFEEYVLRSGVFDVTALAAALLHGDVGAIPRAQGCLVYVSLQVVQCCGLQCAIF